MVLANELLQTFNQALLLFERGLLLFDGVFLGGYLCLLFFDGVDQHGGDLPVLDTFDLALRVASGQKRFDLFDFFRREAEVVHPTLRPIESNRAQATHDVEATKETLDVGFIPEA
jgi:hypothetical protein